MSRLTRHVLVPAIAPLAVVGLYLTPVAVFGCANRGLLALGVVVISLVAGIVTGVLGLRAKSEDVVASRWWLLSTLILAVPALLVLGPLG
jgi:hypothetical protein